MIVYRHADPRVPFLWEDAAQPPARWHGPGEGPVQYFADTPDGAWAEFVRHEEITSSEDLATVRRAIWAVEIPEETLARPRLAAETLTGGRASHPACQAEARRIRAKGAKGLAAPSAALVAGGARGRRVHGGVQQGRARDGRTIVLFGRRPDLVGWLAALGGRPDPSLLERVRHL